MVQISTPLGWPLTGEWAPSEALFVKLLWPLVFKPNGIAIFRRRPPNGSSNAGGMKKEEDWLGSATCQELMTKNSHQQQCVVMLKESEIEDDSQRSGLATLKKIFASGSWTWEKHSAELETEPDAEPDENILWQPHCDWRKKKWER